MCRENESLLTTRGRTGAEQDSVTGHHVPSGTASLTKQPEEYQTGKEKGLQRTAVSELQQPTGHMVHYHFINKALSEPGHAHLLRYCLWLLSPCKNSSCDRDHMAGRS